MAQDFQRNGPQQLMGRARARALMDAMRVDAEQRLGRKLNDGECFCGCGERPPVAGKTRVHIGHVKGEPVGYVYGHQSKKPRPRAPEYAVDPDTGCWVWQRALSSTGYGNLPMPDGSTARAHRVIWEREVGPIPKGLDLDHLCRNRACVNPDHLEPVTRQENLRRGREARR